MKELDVVRLTKNFKGIPTGTKGTIVSEYDGRCCEVEYVDNSGDTIDVVTTPIDILELEQQYN